MTKDILFLASQSSGRRELLEKSGISHQIITQNADEEQVKNTGSFYDYILAIAQYKMKHVQLPEYKDGGSNYLFVITADSLTFDEKKQQLYGKPKDRADARRMLAQKRGCVVEVATACCLHKKRFNGTEWVTEAYKEWVTSGKLEFFVEDAEVDSYLDNLPDALHASGAGVVEGFGLNFVKSMSGSYTAITGLPLYELRQALSSMNFLF